MQPEALADSQGVYLISTMKKSLLLIAAVAAISVSAHASGRNPDGSPLGTGGIANNYTQTKPAPEVVAPSISVNPVATGGNATAAGGTAIAAPIANGGTGHGGNASTGPINNTNTANGGQGGRGGEGGSVLGSGNSSSSSGVVGSGNSSNNNANLQGQQQGQGQVATGGTASAGSSSSSGATSNSGGNTTTQVGGAQNSTQANSVTVNGDTVTYQAQERAPVGTAYAAPLTASNGTCSGSTSAGAQGVSFGLSFGSTWTDASCDLRYDAEALRAAGLPRAAQARLCQKPEIAKAMEAAGTQCPGAAAKVAAVTVTPVASSSVADEGTPKAHYTGNDPIVLKRLGLPPLAN